MANRIVVITGATGGLGTAVVDVFRAAGDTVVTVARKQADYPADLTDEAQTAETFGKVLAAQGRVDVLVHVLGGFAAGGNVEDTDVTVWRRMLDLNLTAAVHVLKSVIPPMRTAGRGRIIAVGSRAGVLPTAGISAYGVSKAALHALIQTAAVELKGSGVTANVVMPGTIRTEANLSWGSADQAAKWVEPSSIAALIFSLASDAAADVSGALIPVYGES